MQINPGLSYTRLSPTHVQIGSGYRALELSGVSTHVRKFLQHLRDGIPDGHERHIAQESKVSELDFELIMAKISPLLVSTPAQDHFVVSTDQEHRGSLARLRCVTPTFDRGKLHGLTPHDQEQFEIQRHRAALQIFGLGRTGAALTKILVESGIGHVNVWDSSRVTTVDTGTGLRSEDIGEVRSLAVAAALNPSHRRPHIFPAGWLKQPALSTLATVHITLGGLDATTIKEAQNEKQPYLPVVIRDDEIDIGPWVVHQAHACPMCLETAVTESDGYRAQRVAALRDNTGGIETVAGAHLVAGLIATDVLTMVDSQQLRHQVPITKHGTVPGMNLDTITRVNLANGWVQTFEVDPRPGCCGVVQELKMASTSSP
ncbi:MAG: hypothetical protein HLX51_10290 [Micrococcaceae bacterium]|nr:hypothetical protein [Micrococcaceae bacterium]